MTNRIGRRIYTFSAKAKCLAPSQPRSLFAFSISRSCDRQQFHIFNVMGMPGDQAAQSQDGMAQSVRAMAKVRSSPRPVRHCFKFTFLEPTSLGSHTAAPWCKHRKFRLPVTGSTTARRLWLFHAFAVMTRPGYFCKR